MDFASVIERIFVFDANSAMLFTQLSFWVFFAVLLFGYAFIYQKSTWVKSTYLLLFSLFFYYKSSGGYFLLLVATIIVDHYLAWALFRAQLPRKRTLLLLLSIVLNLGLLMYFKYSYFFIDLVNQTFDTQFRVINIFAVLGNTMAEPGHFSIHNLVLPVGISFYTFQTLSYAVDIYRKQLVPTRSLIDFAFYVSFFPQLVAGPIVRASEFIPQIYQPYRLNAQQFWGAVFLILNGLVKKIVVSDYISINFVDRVFDNPVIYSGNELLLGAYGYALQIYCDFSGYTDIAIGIALLLGFSLPVNFNSPYKATSIRDFWRRWHISLSTWLRDYLYIPLGGNRKGNVRTYLNLVATMLLGGLWHGANIKFVVWGAIHGTLLALHRLGEQYMPRPLRRIKVPRVLGVLITFHLVAAAWVFFRARNFDIALDIFYRIVTDMHPGQWIDYLQGYHVVLGIMLLGYLVHFAPDKIKAWYKHVFIALPVWVKVCIIVVVVFVMIQFTSSELQPFIYFQF